MLVIEGGLILLQTKADYLSECIINLIARMTNGHLLEQLLNDTFEPCMLRSDVSTSWLGLLRTFSNNPVSMFHLPLVTGAYPPG